MRGLEINGSSPPGAFVGHVGYPRVYVGPLIPPTKGDTHVLDTPELWLGKDIQTIIDFRFSLIRGKSLLDIHDAVDPNSYLLDLHDLALSSASVDVDAKFRKKPRMAVSLSDETQPFGPSALIEKLQVSPSTSERRLEAVYYDADELAVDGMFELYRDGVEVSRIQRTLILGMLNDKDWRVMCEMLAPLATRILLVPVESSRTAKPEELAVVCRAANPQADVRCFENLPRALENAANDKFIVIAGSLYLIGAALVLLDPEFSACGDERGLNEWGGTRK